MAAAAPQDQPAQNGNVVIGRDQVVTAGTARTRKDDRQVSWQAIDTHIQEAAKGQPQDEDRRCENRVHPYPYAQITRKFLPIYLIIRAFLSWNFSTKVTVRAESGSALA